MPSEERSEILQQYLTALESYLNATDTVHDPGQIEQLRGQVDKAFALLGEDDASTSGNWV